MTDEERAEEMEKEAKEYAQGNFYLEQGFLYGYERGFEKGRKEFENENAKQKVQIEKMKCCGNCKHYNYCPIQSNKECQSSNNTLKYKWEFAD